MAKRKDIGNVCVYCHEDTSFGSGLFVNRIPASSDTEDGYMCTECQVGDIPEGRDDKINELVWRLDEWAEEDEDERIDPLEYRKELEAMNDMQLEQEYYDCFIQ